MDKLLFQILILVNILLAISTVVNVIHKLKIINGPNAHIAIAILSLLVLFGYSGVLNTVFLKRRFYKGRIYYLVIAGLCQIAILILSFLSYYNVMTYFTAIAIIHAILGFITMVNFTCAVIVVIEQQRQIESDPVKSSNAQLKRKLEALHYITKRKTYVEIDLEELSQYESLLGKKNEQIHAIEDEQNMIRQKSL